MAEFLAQVEASGLATWVRESPSLWAYPTILTLHSIGLGVVVGASVVIDLRLLGRAGGIARKDLAALFPIIWGAFAVNAVSGVLLFVADATRKSTQPVFLVKLACIALALVVTFRARTLLMDDDAERTGTGTRLGSMSLLLWLGAIAAGRLMAYL
jgi:hypothetical protein